MLKGQSAFKGGKFIDWLERRVRKVDAGYHSKCWLWSLTLAKKGYARWRLPPQLGDPSKMVSVHRASYEHLVGPIPDGLVIDHLCRNRACQNPEHLEPVTGTENTRRGVYPNRNRTHCASGHEYTAENTTIRSNGARRCLICSRRWVRAHRERQREIAPCEDGKLGTKFAGLRAVA